MQPLHTNSSNSIQGATQESIDIPVENSLTNNSLGFLTNQDVSAIDDAIVEFKEAKHHYDCDKNIFQTLKKLTDETVNKLIVIIATNGGNGISTSPCGNEYFWPMGQLLCKAQRREHS